MRGIYMEKLYMLPIDNKANLEARIKNIRNILIDVDYKVYITEQSLAIYIEDNRESEYENKENIKIQKNEEMKYEDFFYNMKKIARSNRFK